MATVLSGKPVAQALQAQNAKWAAELTAAGHQPTLAVIRVGARPDDLYYEKSIIKNCEKVGIACQALELPGEVAQAELEAKVAAVSADPAVDGIFFFSPLPKHLDEPAARRQIAVEKDVDSLTLASAAKVFSGDRDGFAPCTPTAVMELLKFYNIPLAGRRVTVIGRSMVVGKPLAMLLLGENATVTVCHSKTQNLPRLCQQAEVLIAAVGRAKMVDETYVAPGQVVIDVGINEDPDNAGKMCGDINYQAAEPVVEAITPAPGGVGSVTTAVLCKHVLLAAARKAGRTLE